ncbi:hypothetical protein ACFL24_00180 [Patescibacteria group bacterium]
MKFLHSKVFQIIWVIWILILGVSLLFVHALQNLSSFSEYLRAFLTLDLPASWCPTFLTLYGVATLIAVLLSNPGVKKVFTIISRFAGLVLLPVGILATYEYTTGDPFTFELMYFYAQSIHVSEVLTGLLMIYFIAKPSNTK